jgi:hypothetical protein
MTSQALHNVKEARQRREDLGRQKATIRETHGLLWGRVIQQLWIRQGDGHYSRRLLIPAGKSDKPLSLETQQPLSIAPLPRLLEDSSLQSTFNLGKGVAWTT